MRSTRTLVTAFLAAALLVAPAAPPAGAATLRGYDISWPQCPSTVPPTTAQYVVLGTTHSASLTRNPCLAAQVAWAKAHAVPAQGYLRVTFPTAAQQAGNAVGPWSTATTAGRLHDVGWAVAGDVLAEAAAAAWTPPMLWVDVEASGAIPWPTAGPADIARNKAFLEGVLRRFAAAHIPFGIYTNASSWSAITRNWWLPGLPAWATVGPRGEAAALATCAGRGPSSGPVLHAQWWDPVPVLDHDVTCPAWRLAPPLPPSVLPGDVDADWRDDVVMRRRDTGQLWIYRGGANSTFLARLLSPGGWQAWTTLDTPGDMTGDGRADLLAFNRSAGTLVLFPGTGSATWGAARTLATGWQSMTLVRGAGDLTGDGRPDVLARDTAGTLWLYPGNGAGGLGARRSIGTGWNVMDAVAPSADVTGDGKPDLFARQASTGRLWLYPGNGDGTLALRRSLGTGWNALALLAAPGDLTGDAVPDVLALERSTGRLWIYPGDGAGGLRARVLMATGWTNTDQLA